LIAREGKGLEGRKTPLIVPMPNPAKIRSVSEKLLSKIAGIKMALRFPRQNSAYGR
jgi:hypothetical protein